jgi:hypothetical protein
MKVRCIRLVESGALANCTIDMQSDVRHMLRVMLRIATGNHLSRGMAQSHWLQARGFGVPYAALNEQSTDLDARRSEMSGQPERSVAITAIPLRISIRNDFHTDMRT